MQGDFSGKSPEIRGFQPAKKSMIDETGGKEPHFCAKPVFPLTKRTGETIMKTREEAVSDRPAERERHGNTDLQRASEEAEFGWHRGSE